MTRTAFEDALDKGDLWIRFGQKYYKCRRNGMTRTWVRDPDRFEIPIKFRFRDTLRVTSAQFNSGNVDYWFRIGVNNAAQSP